MMDDPTSNFAEHSDHIKVKDLKCWHDMRSTETDNLHVEIKEELKFKVRSDLNKKIFICNGDLTKLEVDAVVLPINDVNLRRSQLAQDIFNTAGTEIHTVYEKYKQNKEMKTGSVSMESGYELPARYIISVMEPKISLKYQSAVETALHGCYVGAFQTASEHDLKSIAFPLLYDPSCEPSLTADMGHIAMRTIRCCLEKLSSKLDSVVLVLTAEQMDLFSNLLSTYFPRSDAEASEFLFWLPSHEFNEWGEIVRA
uniref:Macro domain-containing protein n=1 Tax=Ciona savignyi TaxID=51511 RepID=H2YID1_CIOSA